MKFSERLYISKLFLNFLTNESITLTFCKNVHFQELVGSSKKRPYKKYFLISLIFVIVIAIIVVVVVYVNKGSDPSDESTSSTSTASTTTVTPTDPPVAAAITLEDILNNRLFARRNNATWISATDLLYRNSNVMSFLYILLY